MNLKFSQEDIKFKEEVKDFIMQNLDNNTQKKINNGHHLSKDDLVNWQKKLYEKGWMAPNWPEEYGGTGWSITQRYIFDEECGAAAAPSALPFGVTMVAPVIIKFGTKEQKAKYLPRILSSEDWWCQGYSEPGSGSDLASLSTKAEKINGSYIINGTKTWTTLAQHADMMFILVRTNSDCKPQEGISFMLLDMKSPGVSVKPIITLDGGHEVNMVYLENVKVPRENLIYEENKGWTVAKYLLGHERTSIAAVSRSKKALSKVREIAKLNINGDSNLTDDSRFMDKVTKCDVRLQALEYAELKSISDDVKGIPPGPEASMLKIRGSEIQQEITELVLEASGYYANPYQPNIMDIGNNEPLIGPEWSSAAAPKYFNTRKTTIYGGSNEIQKNILAKMVLEL
jgi:alkylation response protein AidB-like acyl-CoA dehydrogenase